MGIGLAVLYLGGTHLWTSLSRKPLAGTNRRSRRTDQRKTYSFSIDSPARRPIVPVFKVFLITCHGPQGVGLGFAACSCFCYHCPWDRNFGSERQARAILQLHRSFRGRSRSFRSCSQQRAQVLFRRPGAPIGPFGSRSDRPPSLSQPAAAPEVGNGTQEGNALKVSIETQKTESVVVNVLNSQGLLVRRLYQGSWEAGNHQVDWDGKDDLGNPVLPGDYTVTVNAEGKTMSGVVTVQPNK